LLITALNAVKISQEIHINIINTTENNMRTIEQILLDLNPKNLPEKMKDINKQLEYYTTHTMEANGISLIPVLDLLDERYTDHTLRANGYILTVAQLKEDAKKFLDLAEKDPILYNSVLKRLHRSIKVLEQNYVIGNIKNTSVIQEVKKHFLDTLQFSYITKNSQMPQQLRQLIDQKIEEQASQLNLNWYKNNLDPNINTELSELLIKKLLEDSKKNGLNSDIKNKLTLEKNAINSVDALINCFRRKELPSNIQENILTNLINIIKTEISAEKITTNDDLGATINAYQTLKGQHDAISKIIINWQNNQTIPAVSVKLEKYLGKVIGDMKQLLDSNLTEQFEHLAVKAFVDKLQQNQYQENLNSIMSKYSLTVIKELLPSNLENLPKCREAIYADVMDQLHQQWIQGGLPETRNFIQKTVFAFLYEIDDKIQEKVWPNKKKEGIEELIRDNTEMRSKITKLETMLEQQNKILEKVLMHISPHALTNSNANDSAEHLSIKMGMFGNSNQ